MKCDDRLWQRNKNLCGELTFRCKLKDKDQFSRKKWEGIDLGRRELCKTLK